MEPNAKRYAILVVLVLVGSLASFMLFTELQKGPTPAPERYPVLEQDSSVYAALADNLLMHHTFSASPNLEPFRKWPIGYPLFLAVTKYLSGGFLLAVILQVLASIGAAVLLYRMAQTFLPQRFALIPALIFALNPYVLFLNTSVLTDGLFASALIAIIYMLFFWKTEKTLWHFFGIGALLGVATLLRPIAQFLVVVLPLLYMFCMRIPFTKMWRFGAVFVAGFALLVVPWIMRNTLVFGTPEIGHISSFNLLFYDAQNFLLFKELRTVRPQPILLSSSPLYTEQARSAAARVGNRIERDLVVLTPPGGNQENYYGTLGLRYILEDPFYYGYFHLINTLPFFLQGNIRGYSVQARSIEMRNGIVIAPVSLFEAWHTIKSRGATITERAHALLTLAPSAIELIWNVTLILLSLLALLFAKQNRILLVLGALIVYFAILTGPVGIGTPRLHIPAEPYLFLLAAVGLGIGLSLARRLYAHRGEFTRFLIAGGSATALDLVLLYIGTEYLKLHYLVSASIALVIAYTLSFFLQKLWTFRDRAKDRLAHQAFGYAVFVAINIGLNALLLWFFVNELFLWYIAAQVVVSVFIALISYVVYKKILFGTFLARLTTSRAKAT